MLSNLDSPESQGLVRACFLIEAMRDDVKLALAMDAPARAQWHSRNEVRLAMLLMLAEQAQVGKPAYQKIHATICLLHKPLTGLVALDDNAIQRITSLLFELETTGFPCWFI